MAEPQTATAEPAATQVAVPVVTPVVDVKPDTKEDLVTKVTNFKKPASPATVDATYKDFDEITDVKAKEIAINRDKARQADYTRKTQELAQQRKDLETFKEQSKNWTPERIQQELLNNPQFLQAANQLAPQETVKEDYSTLSEVEKAKLAEVDKLKSEVSKLQQSNLQTMINTQIVQKDTQLQTKYSDYNPAEINEAVQQLARMNLADIREFVYKAIRHDEHVTNGVEYGKQEISQLNKEKIGAIGLNGLDANATDSPPLKNKGESDTAYFVRLAQLRLAQSRKK